MYKLVYKDLTELKLLIAMGIMMRFHFKRVINAVKHCIGFTLVPLRKRDIDIGGQKQVEKIKQKLLGKNK